MVGVLSELCRHPKKRAVVDLDRRRCLLVFCCFCVAWWCLVEAQYQQRRHSKTELWQNQKSKKSKNQARRASSMEFPCFHRDERRKGRKQFFKFRSILVAVLFLSENAELRTGEEEEKKKEGGGRLSLHQYYKLRNNPDCSHERSQSYGGHLLQEDCVLLMPEL